MVVAAAAVALAAYTLLPYQKYRDQGRSIEQAKQELLELEELRVDPVSYTHLTLPTILLV